MHLGSLIASWIQQKLGAKVGVQLQAVRDRDCNCVIRHCFSLQTSSSSNFRCPGQFSCSDLIKNTRCCQSASHFYRGGSTVPGTGAGIPEKPAQSVNTVGASARGSILFGAEYFSFTLPRKACDL